MRRNLCPIPNYHHLSRGAVGPVRGQPVEKADWRLPRSLSHRSARQLTATASNLRQQDKQTVRRLMQQLEQFAQQGKLQAR